MTPMRLACYAAVTAGSLAAGGMSVGWFMNPKRAQIAALEQPFPTMPTTQGGERQGPGVVAFPSTETQAGTSLALPPSFPLRHEALEQAGSRYKVVKVTRTPHGLRREVIAQSYVVPADAR
jgi:hypothetical protein